MKNKIKILHIDDNIHDRQLVKDALLKENDEFEVTEADTREKFEKLLAEGVYDLVLSDFNILGFDGLQVLKVVKEANPDLPVIIVTGTGSEEIAIEAMKMGASDYVIKSVKHIMHLVPTIRTVLNRNKAEEARRKSDEALSESERKFKTLTEAAPVGIFSTDAYGITNYVNPRWCEISKLSSDEALGTGWLKAVHPDDRALLSEGWRKAAEAHTGSRAEYRFLHPDGSVAWVSGQAVPEIDSNGTITGYIGTITDITESKRAEEEIAFKHAILQTQQEVSLDGILIVDGTDKIISFNRRFIEMWNIPHNLIETGSDEPVLNFVKELLSDPDQFFERVQYLYDHRNETSIDELFLRDGRIIERYSSPMTGKNNRYYGRVWYFRDITERKRAETRIIESEAYYRTLIDISPDGIVTADMEGKVTYGSRKAYEIFQEPPDKSFVGSSVLNWVDPEFHQLIIDRIRNILAGKLEPVTRAYKLLKHDRSVFWGELSSSPLTDTSGNPNGLLIVCRDITERKRAEDELIRAKEKAEEGDRLKTAFLRNISHEIRTPMNAIVGFSALLGEPDIDRDSKNSYIEVIIQSSNQLLSIVSDIIEISNIEAGILKLNKNDVNLNILLRSLHQQFNPKAVEKRIGFVFETPLSDDDSYIQTDNLKLIQVLINLLNNAFKFTEKGEIKSGYKFNLNSLEFYVSDTGIGIPENQFNRIFDRFYQVEHQASRQYEGTGLGLSICKAYIEFMGGRIWLTSKPGEGSAFFFTIPYIAAGKHEQKQKQKELAEIEKAAIEQKKTLLIAEDEENNFLLLVELLSKLNLKILHAQNGKVAVDFCESKEKIDLVLMDIKMPVMNGFEATALIKNTGKGIPVIALTAYAFESDREKAIAAGCDDYISKPVKRDVLITLVSNYLQ
jgi:PAS domain S-box-containing protein